MSTMNVENSEFFKGVSVSAPSKLILHGEHSVVYGKLAIAGSLNLRTRMTLSPNYGGNISVHFPDIDVKESWDLKDVAREILQFRGLLSELKNERERDVQDERRAHEIPTTVNPYFLSRIQDFLNIESEEASLKMASLTCFFYLYSVIMKEPVSMTIKVESDIPIGAGLGSSAALSVCLAAGLLTVVDEIDRVPSIHNNDDHHKKSISELALLSEKILHGNPSGIDSSISTYGGLIRFQDGKTIPLDFQRAHLRVLLVNTGVDRHTKRMVESVKTRRNKYPDIIDPILESMDGVSNAFIDTFNAMGDRGDSSDHYRTLENLIDCNQKLLEALDVSHPNLDEIVRICKVYKLHGKLTGAGGGGFAYVLIPPYVANNVVQAARDALTKRGFKSWETIVGVGGVKINSCNQ